MSVAYVDLVDQITIAAEVTGIEVDAPMYAAKLDLADSTMHLRPQDSALPSSTLIQNRLPSRQDPRSPLTDSNR